MSDEINEVAPEILHEAESQGWVPKDRFRGHADDWVDANRFVERGKSILPILRKNNENLMKDLNQTKEQLKEFREAAEAFKTFQKETYERKVGDYEKRIQELRENRAQAISEGDGQRVNALDDALDTAKEEFKEAKEAVKTAERAPTPPTPTELDPSLQAWIGKNDWFGQDKRLTGMANGIGESLRAEFPDLRGKPFLDKLDEVLAEEFPDKFGKKKSQGGMVESGSGRQSRGSSNAQSYDNLPSDAKAACDRFVKQKLMSREEYVSSFDWN